MIDIIIISPRTHHFSVTPPLGVGYLLSALKKAGYSSAFIHMDKYGLDEDKVSDIVRHSNPAFIGFSIVTQGFVSAKKIMDTLKPKTLGIKTVIGGPHVTSEPGESLRLLGADMALIGEAEESLVRLLDYYLKGDKESENIDGLVRDINSDKKDVFMPIIEDLDSLDFPDWETLKPSSYPPRPHQMLVKRFPVAPLITSRGCVYNCSFCAVPDLSKHRFRKRNPENVVSEIKMLVEKYNVKEIQFEDDSFTYNKDHAVAVCEAIISLNSGVIWSLPNGIRPDSVDPELLGIMKRAGCYQIGLGIESGNERVMKNVRKQISREDCFRAVRMIKNAGIESRGFYVLGLPGENRESVKDTVKLAMMLDTDYMSLGICSHIPGSSINRALTEKTDYDYASISYFGRARGDKSIGKKYYLYFIIKYYSRFKHTVNVIKRIKIRQVLILLKAFSRLLKYSLFGA